MVSNTFQAVSQIQQLIIIHSTQEVLIFVLRSKRLNNDIF
jgi:hypothetical protein